MEPAAKSFETFSRSGASACDINEPCDPELLGAALELLETLKAEEQILRRFSAAELLSLLPRKEYLVNELGWKLRAAMGDGQSISNSFQPLLAEINRRNTANGVFIKQTLSYWRDLQAILMPAGYGRSGRLGPPSRQPPNGITFQREI